MLQDPRRKYVIKYNKKFAPSRYKPGMPKFSGRPPVFSYKRPKVTYFPTTGKGKFKGHDKGKASVHSRFTAKPRTVAQRVAESLKPAMDTIDLAISMADNIISDRLQQEESWARTVEGQSAARMGGGADWDGRREAHAKYVKYQDSRSPWGYRPTVDASTVWKYGPNVAKYIVS